MSLLLDTHAFVWWLLADKRLTRSARALIEDGQRVRFVSTVSAFEISTKVRIGKMSEAREIAERFGWFCDQGHFEILPVRLEHALLAGRMPGDHRDPFDRLIAAQARVEAVPVITVDAAFHSLDVETLW